MEELKYILFGIGTLAFFANVYLAVTHPELVEGPGGEMRPEADENPLRKWDTVITWLMWGGWALAAGIMYLEGAGFLE